MKGYDDEDDAEGDMLKTYIDVRPFIEYKGKASNVHYKTVKKDLNSDIYNVAMGYLYEMQLKIRNVLHYL